MKSIKFLIAVILLAIAVTLPQPVLAADLGVSPSRVDVTIPKNGTVSAEFQIYYYEGPLAVGIVGMPIEIEPSTFTIEGSPEVVSVDLYTLAPPGEYSGYIRFASTGGTVALAVNVQAKVTVQLSATVATPSTGGGGGASKLPPGTTKVSGDVDSKGVFEETVTATSEDELCQLTIPEGTVGLTEGEYPLRRITMEVMDEPPPPPEDADVIGLPYDFGPDGATFDPPIALTWSYDPDAVPEGLDLVIAYWNGNEWVDLENCVVDTKNNTITADVSHFTAFAIIARTPEVIIAPPVEEPEEFEEIVPPEVVVPEEVTPPEEVAPPVLPEPTGRDLRWLIGVAVFLSIFFPVRRWRSRR